MNTIKTIIVFAILFGLFLLARYIYFKPKYQSGIDAPNFTFETLSGNTKSLTDMKGQYILLDFWGSWCAPCRKESPELLELYNKYSGSEFKGGSSFDIISIGIETNKERWMNAIQKDQLHWDNHYTENNRFKSQIAKIYGVREIPTKYLINPKGKIVAVNPTIEFIHDFLAKREQS